MPIKEAAVKKRPAFVLTTIALLVLVSAGRASSLTQPCTERPCAVTLAAATIENTWRSPQLFSQSDDIGMTFAIDGNLLTLTDGGGCHSWVYGRGVMIMVNTCGNQTPIRLTFVALRGNGPTKVRFTYQSSLSTQSG